MGIQPQSSSPFNQFHHQHHQSSSNNPSLWLVPSKPLASPLVARPQESSSPPRPLASLHHPPEVSRSLTDTSLVPSLSVKSPKTSSPTFASSPLPSVLFKSPLRPTSSLSLRTPTSAPSTPSVSPSSPRTSSLLVVSVANDPR